jgi:hypothetical protein
VVAASSLGGAAREQYAATEAGGDAVAAPPKEGAACRPASRRPPRGERRHRAVRRDGGRWRRVGSAPQMGRLADRPALGCRAASADLEQYAAMQTGGGALAAPPKKVAARRRPASRRPPRGERYKELQHGWALPFPGLAPRVRWRYPRRSNSAQGETK